LTVAAAANYLMHHTRLGRALKAVSNDPELAQVRGVDTDAVILWAFASGSALAGLAGILAAMDVDITPTMGLNALMTAVVAMIGGGSNDNPIGVLLGGVAVGLARNLAAWQIGAQWQDTITFALLAVLVLVRPTGIVGSLHRKAIS
jgi:branched-chain amino acid transport system permease protein